ncbi:HisA/HisF-related TIM barrel protein [Mesoterricola silvestris]|uniref:Uncharacterized protein n=1 Tax=Mesoterricola silvestris TaxID=2927979 RepID=A0AA48K809_9BACT|nr:HisA/HisF-related TIM barrel protein [Mesoterricola silvestris]BDU71736.1 hypothetical protein METEAL_09100 [Mesoterricola silvestris]
MDARRVVPTLLVQEGRVVDPADAADLGAPADWARRLELEGADGILFVERGRRLRRGWMLDVARTLFIPFALEASFADAGEIREALEDGADRVVLGDLEALEAARFGRARVTALLKAGGSTTLEDLRTLDGAGEILLDGEGPGMAGLCAGAAHLPTPILLRCADPARAAEALASGADGIAYPAGLMPPGAFKDLLGTAGIPLRR